MPNQSPNSKDSPKDKKETVRKKSHEYLKYSGMAFEMIIIMGLFTFAGTKLDVYFQTSQKYFTILGVILGTVFALVFTLRDFFFNKKDK